MKLTLNKRELLAESLRRGRLAAARFVLREAGQLLCVAAPLVVHTGQKLEALSERPALAAPPPLSSR